MWRLPCALAETALLKFPALNKVELLLLWLQQQGLDCFQGTLSKNSSCLCLSPPSSQRRSSTAHVPPTPSSPSKACLVWDVLSHQCSGRQARLLQLQEHTYTLSLGMEGSGWQEEQPPCRNSCNNRVGASFKGSIMDGGVLGAKLPRQSRESTSLGTLSIPSSCCSPHSILQRIAKRSLTFPVQGRGGRSFQKQISGQWLLCIQ